MTDSFDKEKHELVSGLVDDQLSEIEIHRLLRRHDDATRDSMLASGQIRAAARRESLYTAQAHVALNERIRAAVAEEPAFDAVEGDTRDRSGIRRPVTGFAAAASLLVAVSAGFWLTGAGPGDEATLAESDRAVPMETRAAPVAEQQVASGTPPTRAANLRSPGTQANLRVVGPPSTELRELDPARQARLKAYLNRHDRLSRMNANVRVVNFENQRR